MKRRVEVSLTKENYRKLMGRMNYLASNRTNMILLTIFLYQDSILSEDRIHEQLEKIKKDNETETFYIMLSSYMQTIFKHKKRYFFTLDDYISAFLNVLLEEETLDWKEIDKKQPKITSIYSIDKDLVDWLEKFSEKTGISQTTFLNYSFIHSLSCEPRVDHTNNKVRKGVYLTQSNMECLKDIETAKRSTIIEQQIKALRTFLE